jgi:electron transfer DM13
MVHRLLAHPRIVGAALLSGAAVIAFVLAYFEPQKLFIDDRVDEAVPVAATRAPSAKPERPARTRASRTLSVAAFRSFEHDTTGRARVIALPDGRRFVRFEDFETSNGPDLKVYLSRAPASGPGDAFDDRYVSLGDLKGNIGAQNYAIPRDASLDAYRSVVVWCKRFSVAFAAAGVS